MMLSRTFRSLFTRNLSSAPHLAEQTRADRTPAGVTCVSTFSAGLGADAEGPVHALPVLRKGRGRVSVLLRPACGATPGPAVLPVGDWRELAAQEQCPACHQAVAA